MHCRTALVALCLQRRKKLYTRRKLFHAARAGSWALFIAIILLAILTSTISVSQEQLDVKDFGGTCLPVNVVLAFVFFAALLVNDLLWLGLLVAVKVVFIVRLVVFGVICVCFFKKSILNPKCIQGLVLRSLHRKPFLILHHCIYLVWVVLTVHGDIHYVHLVFAVSALEESQELVASICYLRKDSTSGQWWQLFTHAWWLMCCSFAIGVMALFLMLGTLGWAMITFIPVDIALWCIFLWQEWSGLADLVLENMPAPEKDNDEISASEG